MRTLACVTLVALAASGGGLAPPAPGASRVVAAREIAEAMRESQGYDLRATANGPRLNAEVVLRLVRRIGADAPDGPPLRLSHDAWLEAYLERTGLAAADVPLYLRLSHEYGQEMTVDYRPGRVVREVVQGPRPSVAASVRIVYSDLPKGRDSFSYEDLLSRPRLKVTNAREVSYRLLDLGDRIVYADIRGLRGRPTSGALGALFRLIGEPALLENRMAISGDGLQVLHGHGRKAFLGKWATVTVFPDGRAERGLPIGRDDLRALEARLEEPLEYLFTGP